MTMIIDNPLDLMELSDWEIDQKLLDQKYNTANLRELVRRFIALSREYKDSSDDFYYLYSKYKEKYGNL